MKLLNFTKIVAISSASLLLLSGCGSDNPTGAMRTSNDSSLRGTLTGRGASSQNSAVDAWKSNFNHLHPNARVQYSPDGSGAGKTALLSGAVGFAGSDSYLKDSEMKSSQKVCGPEGAINLPVYINSIAIAYNLPEIPNLQLSPENIAKIFSGTINKWNSPEIIYENPGINFPDTYITPVHRSDESGTTQSFTEYLSAKAPNIWTSTVSQQFPRIYRGESAKGNAGVVQTVNSAYGAIGYADSSAVGSSLNIAAVKVSGSYVLPTAEAVSYMVDSSPLVAGRPENDISIALARDNEIENAYPLVLVSYHIICSSYRTQEEVDLLVEWERYVVSEDGQQAASIAANAAPLPASLREKIVNSLATIRVIS